MHRRQLLECATLKTFVGQCIQISCTKERISNSLSMLIDFANIQVLYSLKNVCQTYESSQHIFFYD